MIRPAIPEDMPVLIDIWLRAARRAHDFLPAVFWEERSEDMASRRLPDCEIQVLDANGRVLGFAALHDDHLEALFVDPEAQGFGHGSELMAHAMAGRERITLRVYSRNVRAVSFYRRLGFHPHEEREDPSSGEREVLMIWTRTPLDPSAQWREGGA